MPECVKSDWVLKELRECGKNLYYTIGKKNAAAVRRVMLSALNMPSLWSRTRKALSIHRWMKKNASDAICV